MWSSIDRTGFTSNGEFYYLYVWSDDGFQTINHKLTRIATNGEIDWQVNFTTNRYYDKIYVDNFGNAYLVGGYDAFEDPTSGLYLRKYSPQGTQLFDIFYPSNVSRGDPIIEVADYVDRDGNIYLSGYQDNLDGNCWYTHSWRGGASFDGTLIWSKSYGGVGTPSQFKSLSNDGHGNTLLRKIHLTSGCLDEDCGYIEGCIAVLDTTFIKLNPLGETDWEVPYNSENQYELFPSGNLYKSISDPNRLIRRKPSFELDWEIELTGYYYSWGLIENLTDNSVLVNTRDILNNKYILSYYNADGTIRWTKTPENNLNAAFGPDGKLYIIANGFLKLINPANGAEMDSVSMLIDLAIINCIDEDGAVYVSSGSQTHLAKYTFGNYLTILDTQGETIPDTEFELYKVENDEPMFTEEYLGKFTTDSEGRLEYTTEEDTISVELDEGTKFLANGDLIKVSKIVHNEPAVKHPTLLKTMYSLHLDNIKFDSLGAVSFYEIGSNEGDIVLDHAELRYNLVVSVQWDATSQYLLSLESSFSYLSDYLYDVYDGQVRLDTIMIFDNEEHWLEADVRIFSSNSEWPRAYSNGINDGMAARSVFFPRKFYSSGNNADDSYLEYPYELTETDNYRTMGHEFGHYAMNFFDEYVFMGSDGNFNQTDRCTGHITEAYGYMDKPYVASGQVASELSSVFDYQESDCRNTQQFYYHGMSCWDYFRQLFEGYYESVWVPVSIPGDAVRNLPPGLDYFPGPNNDEMAPDYYVGFKTVFPIEPTGPTAFDLDVVAHDATTLDRMGGVEVTLLKERAPGDWYSVPQGKTSTPDASGTSGGGIFILGAETGDRIRMVSDYSIMGIAELRSADIVEEDERDKWMFGEVTVQNSGATTLSLQTVDGYYPAICEASIEEEKTEFFLRMPESFKELPAVILSTEDKTLSSTPQVTSYGYSTSIYDSIGITGHVSYTAIDNSSNNFFFDNSYTITEFRDTSLKVKMALGCQGLTELIADSASGIERVMLLNSPYLVPKAGLESNSIQAGDVISVSTLPHASLENGGATLIIRYNDIDLKVADGKGAEGDLSVYKWDIEKSEWSLIGGTPDTIRNMIVIHIDSPGVYAAFTSSFVTHSENRFSRNPDDGFMLSQNYPNPFNQATKIEFTIPKTSRVKLDILNINGQLVRTLVNTTLGVGTHKIQWDSKDDLGNQVSGGVYLYRLTTNDYVETKNMILLK